MKLQRNLSLILGVALALLLGACDQPAGGQKQGNPDPVDPIDHAGPVLREIMASSFPDTLVYALGEEFDPAGLVVEALYSDESSRVLEPAEYTLTGADTGRAGAKMVTVTAGDCSARFAIMVNNSSARLQSITLVKPPDKTAYYFSEVLNQTGTVVRGHYSDGSTKTETVYKVTGYDRARRGEQTLSLTVNKNAGSVTFPVMVRIPATAEITMTGHNMNYGVYAVSIKGRSFSPPANLTVNVRVNGVGGAVTGFRGEDFSGYNPATTGLQTLTLSLDEKSVPFYVYNANIEPGVYFDYGYMRHGGDPTGQGPGAGVYYVKPNETLVLAPVRVLIGYGEDHRDLGASYSWSVEGGGSWTPSPTNGEFFSFTPSEEGTYTVKVAVRGRNYITGETESKESQTTVECYTQALPRGTFTGLQNFAPGQFTVSGNGFGWSLGAAGGYQVWEVPSLAQYTIRGNPMPTWGEPGIVWVMEDRNGNGLPDETWYELKGGDDVNPAYQALITRRYSLSYYKIGDETTVNEFNQTIGAIGWVDAKGRTGVMGGGWPSLWGVSGDWVTYTCTLLRDNDDIVSSNYTDLKDWAGYVDVQSSNGNFPSHTFSVAHAMRADGSPAHLSQVKFIKVQTAVFRYGGTFGEISTEIVDATNMDDQSGGFPDPNSN